eukprot:TRINITY_DN14576_c0_g1_i1.p1 TRINITY_DN14576_c0_g1~~TRINITY_DN14576_c0_g1_i1.p1  ORF type:complete len:257 (+),score=39.65 TRINITY_DN14576_c0_g1_i1:38-772(+)
MARLREEGLHAGLRCDDSDSDGFRDSSRSSSVVASYRAAAVLIVAGLCLCTIGAAGLWRASAAAAVPELSFEHHADELPAADILAPFRHGRRENVVTLYHTTAPEIADLILANGFKPGKNGWCGGAIYFFGSSKIPRTKLGPDSSSGAILEAKVDLGKMGHLDKRCTGGADPAIRAKYDSVTFNPGDGDEYIVFTPDRVLDVKMWDGRLHALDCCWLGVSCSLCPAGDEWVWPTTCGSSRRCKE